MRLLLFDVDGTLIHSHGAGRDALRHALEEVFGTAGPLDEYSMAGKTDPLIVSDVMAAAGIPAGEIEDRLPDVYARMEAHGRDLFPRKGIVPCPGVPELLAALNMEQRALLGLLTGNIHLTTPLKLAAAGINPRQFRLGAYGSDAKDRNRLPAVAMERASKLLGHSFNGTSTVIIGDTPADIICARAGGATAVAVASGNYSAATLATYEPDHLIDNLMDTQAVIQILLDGLEK